MSQKVVVLGAGMIGSAIAIDLAAEERFHVTVADVRADALARVASRARVDTVAADLASPAVIGRLAAGYDLVLGALPSMMGFQALRSVIEARRPYVDISFMAENALELDGLARRHGVTAVVDCGVAPGVSNMMVGRAAAALDRCERVEIYVGGLPVERHWPFEYKAGFAPHDVIEEYVRPARVVEHGRIVVKEALSEAELMDVPGVGTLEAFNTDGLRSLVHTIKAPFMKEKTLRYPGHAHIMQAIRELGLLSLDPVDVKGTKVVPRDAVVATIGPKLRKPEGRDLVALRVIVAGTKNGLPRTLSWELIDRYDERHGISAMMRTTGYSLSITGQMQARGEIVPPGVHTPDECIPPQRYIEELAKRGIMIAFRDEGQGMQPGAVA